MKAVLALVATALIVGPASDPRRAAMRDFLAAAGRGDGQAMARLVSSQTRSRLGPGGIARLQAAVRPIARSYRFILSERITNDFAVVAVAGPAGVFASALRGTRAGWKLELMGPVRLEAVRPLPGERIRRRTQVAAEVGANRVIVEAGLWFDGKAFASRGAVSSDGRHMSMFGEAPQPLSSGSHTVVAFAAAGGEASALAWTFSVRRR